jgi:demethylmenaquinone methyltransferase/2-methoxy-6-polyprenyl-1,4-benzoquinol methylase
MSEWKQKRRVMRRYDLTAQMYDVRYAEEQEAKYKVALENLSVTCNSIVLDVGCGTGLLFSHVAVEAETIAGVDVSKKLLLQARKRARKFRSVHLVQADADHLPFKNACFSVVFAFTVLQNMPRPLETLNELKRVTKFGGNVVVTGLKKAFGLEAFGELLEHAGLRVNSFADDETLKCYIVVSTQNSK